MDSKGIFAQRIDDLIARSGKTQKAVAEEMDVSPTAISDYRRGDREPSAYMLKKIAEYFGVTLDYLAGREECTTPDNELIHKRLGLSDGAIKKLEEYYHSAALFPTERGYPALISALIETKEGRELLGSINQYVLADLSKIFTDSAPEDDRPEDNGSDTVTFRSRQETLSRHLSFFMKAENLEGVFRLNITDKLKDFRKAVESWDYWAPYHPQDQSYPDPMAGIHQASEKLAATLSSENLPSTVRKKGKHVNPEDSE